MNILGAIVAGLAGTLVFTWMLYYAGPLMSFPKMDIIGLIGSMFSTQRGPARALGTIGHIVMGTIFGLIYAIVWNAGFGAANWIWGIVFGVVHGLLVAFVGMPAMLAMHPRRPEMVSGSKGLMGMLAGHAVFGLIVGLVYPAFVQ